MTGPLDLTGKTFGMLKVVERAGTKIYSGKKKSLWRCVCECGELTEVVRSSLVKGLTTSCGCRRTELSKIRLLGIQKRKNGEDVFWKKYRTRYAVGARTRGLGFELSIEQVREFASQDCFYCGEPPKPDFSAKNAYINVAINQRNEIDPEFADSKVVRANGLDRYDNQLGYTVDNVVPCCYICNRAKMDMPIWQWQTWIRNFINHQKKDPT